jgi:adenylate cyclase
VRRPFGAGRRRLIFLSGIVPVLMAAVMAVSRPRVFVNLDNAVYDIVSRATRPTSPDSRIVIVDIDERSLSTVGQWPWRRDLVARLVERLRERGVSLIAFDIIFAEVDRYMSPQGFGQAPAPRGAPTPDQVLAGTLEGGRVILGYGLTFDPAGRAQPTCVLHPLGIAILQASAETDHTPFFRATGAVCNLPMLALAAGASGYLNAAPDGDGILRRVPLLAEFDGRLYPSLGVAAVASVTGTRHFALRVSSVNDATLSIDDRMIPVDAKGNLLVRFRGGKRTFPYISAADVLSGEAGAESLRDKIVFVGTSALGTREVVSTPLDTLFTGVEVQATVADNLLQQDFISRSAQSRMAEVASVLVLGSAVAALFAGTGVGAGLVAGAAGAAALWWAGVWLLSSSGIFLSPVFGFLGIASALAAMTFARFGVERGRADRAGRERTAARGLMVQALLSLTEVRDAETGRHSVRTQLYARVLAKQLASDPGFRRYLTPARIELLSSLAPLHDIGKVGIPDHILNKPGSLTAGELAQMRQHPTLGREVILKAEARVGVRDDETLAMAKDIVYTHHERWDGTGYPLGLAGEAIPLQARIVAVADAYDAMTSGRVYQPAVTDDVALAELQLCAGSHFDPKCVGAFVTALGKAHDENAFPLVQTSLEHSHGSAA